MKTYAYLVIAFFLGGCNMIVAQEIDIFIPSSNINTNEEFSEVLNVMFLDRPYWRSILPTGENLGGVINPTFTAMGAATFIHNSNPNISLPASVLEWRLESLGGISAPFKEGDVLPNYKTFSSTEQSWYEPARWNNLEYQHQGIIAFEFKIPSSAFEEYNFESGTYSMEVYQNYAPGTAPSGSNDASITPAILKINLHVSETFSWISGTNSFSTTIQNLNEYRSSMDWNSNMGEFQVSSSSPYNLKVKSHTGNIHFTSSQNEQEEKDISMIYLKSNHPQISPIYLSNNFQYIFDSQNGSLQLGNALFDLQVLISSDFLRDYFFRAGNYKFQFEIIAEKPDLTAEAKKMVDYELEVAPLSEMKITDQGQSVDFDFNTVEDYTNGKIKTVPGQLTLSNNDFFELYAKSGSAYFHKSGVQTDIEAGILQINIDGSGLVIDLSQQPQKLLTHQSPVLDKIFDVVYKIPAEASQELLEKEKGIYSIQVFFSFIAL